MSDSFVWDDQLWDHVWERTLNQAERHHIAVSVLRRRLPDTPLEHRVARELARRWRRHAATLAVVYAVWTLFWGALGFNGVRAHGAAAAGLPLGCAAIGLAAVTTCVWFRQRMSRLRRFRMG